MAGPASQTSGQAGLAVAAVARFLGVAPATLRTWDRRYGLKPSGHREGQHRRYTEADLARLQMMRRLILQGMSTAEAARAASTGNHDEGSPPEPSAPMAHVSAGDRERSGSSEVTVRQLREAARRMDADRVVAMLTRAVSEHGVSFTWEGLIRPTLTGFGDRWAEDAGCIAVEHLLSECAASAFHQVMHGRMAGARRPVLLLSAPDEGHVLPLQALAAALSERAAPSRLLGASTPVAAASAAARRLQPSAIVIWAQSAQTADIAVFEQLPSIRGGCLLVAAGPGWAQTPLPDRVIPVNSLAASLSLLAPGSTS